VENQKKELIQLNQVKDTLLRVVSHDFRAPLVALHSMIQLLDLGVHSQEEFYEITGKLRKHVYESIGSLDNIIFWSRTQMQGFKMNNEAFDLRAFSEEVVNAFQPELNVKQLRVDNRIANGSSISCDRDVLRIILRNLMSNAIKFSYQWFYISF
jgi:signal transduction histidine kinase